MRNGACSGMPITDAQVHIWSSGTPSVNHRPVPAVTAAEMLAEMLHPDTCHFGHAGTAWEHAQT